MEARKSCTQLLKLHNSQPYNEEHIYYLLWMLRCLLGLPHCLNSLSHVLYCLDYDMPSGPNKPLERMQWYNRIGKVEPSFGISPSYSRKSYLVCSVLGSVSNPPKNTEAKNLHFLPYSTLDSSVMILYIWNCLEIFMPSLLEDEIADI